MQIAAWFGRTRPSKGNQLGARPPERRVALYMGGRGYECTWSDDELVPCPERSETRGGAMCFIGEPKTHISDAVFVQNRATRDGGAIYFLDCDEVVLERCVFAGNSAKWGGAVFFEKVIRIVLRECLFVANTASALGAAVSFSRCQSTELAGCAFSANSAFRQAGDIEFFECSQCLFSCVTPDAELLGHPLSEGGTLEHVRSSDRAPRGARPTRK